MRVLRLLPMMLVLAACQRPVDTGVQALPPSPVVDHEPAAAMQEQELDWLQMMPGDELAALERGEGPQVEHNGNRRMPQFGTFRTVGAVLQRPVRLPGYVVPLATAGRAPDRIPVRAVLRRLHPRAAATAEPDRACAAVATDRDAGHVFAVLPGRHPAGRAAGWRTGRFGLHHARCAAEGV